MACHSRSFLACQVQKDTLQVRLQDFERRERNVPLVEKAESRDNGLLAMLDLLMLLIGRGCRRESPWCLFGSIGSPGARMARRAVTKVSPP